MFIAHSVGRWIGGSGEKREMMRLYKAENGNARRFDLPVFQKEKVLWGEQWSLSR
jgi:hypothetical protein